MCIAYLAISAHADWPLFIAANRDEFHNRPTLPAAPWPGNPNIIAGTDCLGGGTWLGITRQGRFALLTNYRDPKSVIASAPSRGELVSDYLNSSVPPEQHIAGVHVKKANYNGFNLIAGDAQTIWYVGNRTASSQPQVLTPGRYVLSNHVLDTPWPKAERLRQALEALSLEHLHTTLNPVFALLKDGTTAAEHLLPETGLSRDMERLLSSPFIVSPDYGTRCSTVIAVHASGQVFFSEVSYDSSGTATERHDWPFVMSA